MKCPCGRLLGKVARSTSRTRRPCRARSIAVGAPAQRAPFTMTSYTSTSVLVLVPLVGASLRARPSPSCIGRASYREFDSRTSWVGPARSSSSSLTAMSVPIPREREVTSIARAGLSRSRGVDANERETVATRAGSPELVRLRRRSRRRNGARVARGGSPRGHSRRRDLLLLRFAARRLVSPGADRAARPAAGRRSHGTPEPRHIEDHFGLLASDFWPKPAFDALAACW